MYDAESGDHIYLSTACLHDLHDRCRLICKYCGTSCWCRCHYEKEPPMSNPENLDNPVAPDADLDDPQAPGNVEAPDLGVPGEAEPLPEGDADADDDGIPDEDDDDLADDDPEDIDDTEDDEALTGEPVVEPEDG